MASLYIFLFFAFSPAYSQVYLSEFRIGVVLPLSGVLAEVGQAQANGLKVFGERLNWYGVPVSFVIRDDRSDPSQTLSEAQALVSSGVQVLICCTSVEALSVLANYWNSWQLPIISLSYREGLGYSPWFFSVGLDGWGGLERILSDISGQGLLNVAILSQDAGLRVWLEQKSPSYNLYPLFQSYSPNNLDLKPESLYVATRNPQAIILWDEEPWLTRAYLSLRQWGYGGLIYGNYSPQSSLSALEGLIMVYDSSHYSPSYQEQPNWLAFQDFRQAYEARYGQGPYLVAAALSYDALNLLKEAFNRSLGNGVAMNNQQLGYALRDALVAMPQRVGARAIYDFIDNYGNSPSAIRLESFPLFRVIAGHLEYVR
ncbi:MAG: ABC transporter substrate-binding protein [Deinococcales bacterium]